MSEKRHRIYANEMHEVINGLLLRLEQLTGERKEEEKAKIVYHTLYRLMYVEKGRPKYPNFSWDPAETYLHMFKEDT